MKPVSVRFKGFGPYMEEQFIDFSELEKNGLFLISGETGAGKTTILDAICYALYCESSGGQRGDIENMRCKLADKTDETLVEFIFDSMGTRYKFSRALKYKTKNLHSYHNCYVLKEDVWEVLDTGMKQVSARAEKIVGLTSSQFRQVIILPQGKFEEFLVSDSKKKEEILVTLFNVQQWSRISEEISRRVNRRAAELVREKMIISEGLHRYGCPDLEALDARGRQLEEELEAIIPRVRVAEAEEEQARKVLQEQLQVEKAFAELTARQKRYDNLLNRSEVSLVMEQSLLLADKAEQIREVFDTLRAARREQNKAEESFRSSSRAVQASESALADAARRLSGHMSRERAMEEKKAHLLRLENLRDVYEKLSVLRGTADAAREQYTKSDQFFCQKQEALKIRERELAGAFDTQKQAREEYEAAQIRYRLGIGGILAQTLEDGKPCPVCGSSHHPSPARQMPEHVSEAQLDKLSKAMGKADKAVTGAIKARSQAEQERNTAQAALHDAQQTQVLAQAECQAAEKQKISGIDTAEALERTVSALGREIHNWEQEKTNLTNAQSAAQGNFQAAKQALESAEQSLTHAREACIHQEAIWEVSRRDAGFGSEQEFLDALLEPREKQRRRELTAAFRSDLKVAKSALDDQIQSVAGKSLQDMAALKQTLSQAEKDRKQLTQQQILLDSQIKALRSDEKALTARMEKNAEALITLEADQVFARRLAGSHGVGLQRYVLGVMMNSITAQANRLLENVYGGRYRLYRTDETTGRTLKGGLELEVSDSHNNQRRSVRTLSGGEKFLVALSLAIGLSTVVQAQGEGIRLEAMFIDEGFGSLDREAIQDALDILQGIRATAGVVGIISHVELLAETIPARIEITKGNRGSRARILGL